MDIITISQNILIVGGALIIILGVIAMFYLISILIKINSMIKDMKHRYDMTMNLLFSPIEFVANLFNKFSK